ncbi:MAG TPA: hypothetical protein VMB71_11665 [Acetobacteraceae bacterium]|nr:hypothetical protein [Acetobacteraceae bacterium]
MHDLKLVAGFAFHTVVAVALFAMIGGAAALLDYYTKVLGNLGMPEAILLAIKATEYFLFAVDLLCFVVYVTRETWLLLRAMFTSATDHAAAIEVGRVTD